ncbi:DUF7666 domain-containing protein [Bosea spartocytisi]|uniref:DUF7666 domain-containing protein n=1 Tax=Bosea spartocytisi TaxID=2773451 RepID=UPI0021AADAFA|nr:hypothetical protein [Bosea spartocytisi]MCT4470649.1 hypothetical protein [Bosea spartocytisi]
MATKAKKQADKVEAPAKEAAAITSIKGFDHEFKCRGFQFEVGKTYEVKGDVKACRNGFHAVSMDAPLHVWDFYPIIDDEGRLTRYAITEQTGATDEEKTEKGTKIASASISIKMELSLPEFIRKAVERIVDLTRGKTADAAGYSAQIGSSGYYARIGSSGCSAQIGSSGYYARIGSSGDYAQIGSSGDYAQIGSSGDYAQIGSSGDSAQIGSSGYYARIGSSGCSAQIGSSGDYARIGSSGDSAQIGSSGDYARIGSSGDSAQIGSSGDSAQIGSSGYYARIGSSGCSAQIGSSGYYAQIGSSGDYAQIGSSGDSARINSTGRDAVIASAGPGTTASGIDGAWVSLAEFIDGKCVGFATGCIGKDGLKPNTAYRALGGKLVEVE